MKELRAYIREVMRQKNLKVKDIQAQSGGKIKDAYISDILSGKTKSIGVEKLIALAEGLGVDSLELFKAAAGNRVDYSLNDPWPGRALLLTLQKIMDNPDLTALVKAAVDLKPAKLKALLKQLEKE